MLSLVVMSMRLLQPGMILVRAITEVQTTMSILLVEMTTNIR